MAAIESPTKFVREFYEYDWETQTKKVSSRWHYDLVKFSNGPILAEELAIVEKKDTKHEKKSVRQNNLTIFS